MRAMRMWGAGLMALLVAGAAQADVKAGVDAWQAGDYGRAVAEWKPLADAGDADAQFNLGQAYKLGQGVPKNMVTAQDLFTKAANQGHEQAQATLGLILFQNGDRTSAMPWIKKAAEAGEPRAQYIYGTALYNGDVVGRDLPLAYAMMSRAASAGLPQATNSLAVMNQRMPQEDRTKGEQLALGMPTSGGRTLMAGDKSGASSAPDRGAPRVAPSTFSLASVGNSTVQTPAPTPTPAATKPVPAPKAAAAPKPVALAAAETKAPKPVAPKPAAKPKVESAAAKPAAPAVGGAWRVQLGAFSSSGNAREAWKKFAGNAAVSGHSPSYSAAGSMTRLQVAGFASAAAAEQACAALKRSGAACLPVKP